MNRKKTCSRITWWTISLFILIQLQTNISAQVTIGSNKEPSKFSLLDLDASTQKKGLHLPRLTATERDALLTSAADSVAAKGQFIFNLDSDCLNFWDGNEWKELCNSANNPEVTISDCNKIRKYGAYYRNAPLNNTHYVIVPVTVVKKGHYSIVATSGNGYYFQANGVFGTDNITVDLRLEGIGTPSIAGTDSLVFTCNGTPISNCNTTINVGLQTMGYRVDCDSIKVFGSYLARRYADGANYVEVPIEVFASGNTAVISTNIVNGLSFSGIQTLANPGSDVLVLKAQGQPMQAGKFTYTFTTNGSLKTTCTFDVECISTLGSYANPAGKCLDIYKENPMAPNGEYWMQADGSSETVRTYCDITGGGWTLMWSYSERTARNDYGSNSNMTVPGNPYAINYNTPRNRITVSNGNDSLPTTQRLNYNDFRLNQTEWRNGPDNKSTPQIKVRITNNPTDMTDEWGQNNYGIISPQNQGNSPLEYNFDSRGYIPAIGKIYGKKWEVRTSGAELGGWDEITNGSRRLVIYTSGFYCTHWDWGNSGSTQLFEVYPNPGNLSASNNAITMHDINNAFGWFGESQHNHHFGKCYSTSDDYSFTVKTCSTNDLYPHSFNNGEGRYCQWFVK